MSKEIKTTIVEASEIDNYNDEDGFTFKHPSKFYVLTSLNQLVYIHVRSRAEAQGFGNPDCQECGVNQEDFESMPTMEEIISDAVAQGIEKYEKSRLQKKAKASKVLKFEVAEQHRRSSLRVFPSWRVAKEDINAYREEHNEDILKFNVKEAKAYLKNGGSVLWMVSNGKDLDKFQGLFPKDAYFHADVDEVTRNYVSTRIR